ncbi:formate dehydrogenase accessory sulfurtransferase FdhD [Corynebacterium rouxii]|uniref:formate dehydrogenase accessory sulfurtransferase FdhD n=1 Tax=Corynebacterium rouxii TaxID=2719119 RepID=UPI00313B8E3E
MARITSLTAVDSFFCEDAQWQHGTRQRTVLNDEQLSVLIHATPYTVVDRVRGHDVELIHGMLRQQGVIGSVQQVSQACYCAGSVAGVNPYNRMDIDIIPAEDSPDPVKISTLRCTPEQIQSAFLRLLKLADLRRKTSATHAAGIFGSDGDEVVVRECLTAHQAGWKVLGAAMMSEDPSNAVIFATTGLIDATVVDIARLCGCSTVVSSAPAVTSAIADAHRAGITLIGALGDATFKLYAGVVDL